MKLAGLMLGAIALATAAPAPGAPTEGAPPSSLQSGSVLEAAKSLKPGQFLWAPQVAPSGPVLLAVSLATQRAEVYRNGLPIGFWVNPAHSVVVEISMCGDDTLCGHVRWASGKAIADARANGTDPLAGTQLLRGFAPAGPDRWKGRLFVPDLRKTSRAELRVIDDQQLKIVGCAAGGLICKSQLWRRIDPATLPPAG